MSQFEARCKDVKDVYDECFSKWYKGEFLRGNLQEGCIDEFKQYRECYMGALRDKVKEIKNQRDQAAEGSQL
ncbi:Mitochondrial distribution and morphology protein 35 [Plasmodiophora brassicae]|uniref:Mitochondrial distribution and morphology protein 35 n=1 Tax=Plasmodiophora brassicae TaxID=37360 RepID=A0A3P3Y263_PLABS|nr:unnamed protein product [Plasmodiophora brassicae]